jgi:Protein of unknown function (DUF1572)
MAIVRISGQWRTVNQLEWAGTPKIDSQGHIERSIEIPEEAYQAIEARIANGSKEGALYLQDGRRFDYFLDGPLPEKPPPVGQQLSAADELTATVMTAAVRELQSALERITHCLGQLTDAQIWWRDRPEMNSIGNLLLHLCGNVRQWIIAGLGNVAYKRNRPAEFSERGPIARIELLQRIETVVSEAMAVLQGQTSAQLITVRHIQGFDVTSIAAIFNSVAHFRGHTQEIIHMTRVLLGDAYQFAWQPSTPEQGAP